ncbi:MAG: hypothetical protein E7663_02535 [Ruminococcaceae bacterium]|nr:hypothetical protein [Oscillospiraceae bacterium]
MKIWKMLGCLALLCIMICGCAALGTTTAAQTGGEEQENAEGGEEVTGGQSNLSAPEQSTPQGSVTVTPTYSEGLRFRSNGDGTCALSGMGSCTASCLLIPPKSPSGDTVTEILPFALKDSIIGAIEIPAGVTTLSADSFSGCARLAYIRVAANNTSFAEHDGVLYSKDLSTLIYCPSGRSGATLNLQKSLRRIRAGAFAECTTLTTVVFAGTTSEWHQVIIGDLNQPLYDAGFRFEE